MSTNDTRRIGPFTVHSIGLGCMNISHAYGTPSSAEQGERLLLAALDAGYDLFDTAALYGFGANETLVGRVLAAHRKRIVLTSKGGMAGVKQDDGTTKRVIDGRPATLRRNCEDSLRRLQTEAIDVYYLHRLDPKVPIEESVGEMGRLLDEGKVRALGLSEVSAATIRRAHRERAIVAVQNEYSLWTRNVELGVLDACREIGAAMVAFSPVARGFLAGQLRDVSTLDAKDIRRAMPRFSPELYAKNLTLLAPYEAIAKEQGCTPAQLALVWLLNRGEHVLPIPGTTNPAHARDNLAAREIRLDAAVLANLDALINQDTVHGERYNQATQAEIDTETYPRESVRPH
jgi:aryl-alcohol dehydrogenase-like predicted oxidoreductase